MEASLEKQFEELRSRNRVRLVSDEESGAGIDRLPGGVYGFTYSPAESNFPLFKERPLRSYEAHKLADGTAMLLGFVPQGDSLKMEAGRESVTVRLFPEPQEEAGVLVSIAMVRVLSRVEHSQRGGKGLELEIGPVS
jgi:hypothetical protein